TSSVDIGWIISISSRDTCATEPGCSLTSCSLSPTTSIRGNCTTAVSASASDGATVARPTATTSKRGEKEKRVTPMVSLRLDVEQDPAQARMPDQSGRKTITTVNLSANHSHH